MSEQARFVLDHHIVVATHNPGKLEEIARLLAQIGCHAIPVGSFGLTAPDEDADSFAGNAAIKARHASRVTGRMALADDSGLCVPGLNGRPGLETARWARENGGWTKAQARIHQVLTDGKAWNGGPKAVMHCALAVAYPNGVSREFSGRVMGRLTWPPRGPGSGFDPMFVPDGYQQSFGEMASEDKAAIDARAHAFESLMRACEVRTPYRLAERSSADMAKLG